ncbi:MAG: DMT family transporter [Clostridia bacterium]|nr:DMT family transporter [Clostridia bacterium]
MRDKKAAVCYALAAAVFYALNVPCSKLLLGNIAPTVMAALLYLGAGTGVGVMYIFHRSKDRCEEKLSRSDLPYVIGMVLLDIIAPILLMLGVNMGTASSASLLGSFETAATAVIALALFGEKVSKKLWTAIGLITLSSVILSLGGGDLTFSPGSLLILGATICWGLENNCTRSISGKSTYQIVIIKGVGSGTGSLVTAFIIGERLPGMQYIPPALALGFVAYGLSIFTYIRAQKTLGAAKTGAYYAAAPFIGAFLSFALLREPMTASYFAALIVMVSGVTLAVADTLRSESNRFDVII